MRWGLGADVIVAQGTEAGGHGARNGRSTLPFVPAVVDLVAPTPGWPRAGSRRARTGGCADARGGQGGHRDRFQATAEASSIRRSRRR